MSKWIKKDTTETSPNIKKKCLNIQTIKASPK